jgi:hypothetical protein
MYLRPMAKGGVVPSASHLTETDPTVVRSHTDACRKEMFVGCGLLPDQREGRLPPWLAAER